MHNDVLEIKQLLGRSFPLLHNWVHTDLGGAGLLGARGRRHPSHSPASRGPHACSPPPASSAASPSRPGTSSAWSTQTQRSPAGRSGVAPRAPCRQTALLKIMLFLDFLSDTSHLRLQVGLYGSIQKILTEASQTTVTPTTVGRVWHQMSPRPSLGIRQICALGRYTGFIVITGVMLRHNIDFAIPSSP